MQRFVLIDVHSELQAGKAAPGEFQIGTGAPSGALHDVAGFDFDRPRTA
jgi:hypothetical protein